MALKFGLAVNDILDPHEILFLVAIDYSAINRLPCRHAKEGHRWEQTACAGKPCPLGAAPPPRRVTAPASGGAPLGRATGRHGDANTLGGPPGKCRRAVDPRLCRGRSRTTQHGKEEKNLGSRVEGQQEWVVRGRK